MERTSSDITVQFNGANIITTVTNDPSKVEVVLAELRASAAATRYGLVGLNVKYKLNENSTVATLHLCHGNRCLVIQLSYMDSIPGSLRNFLGDASIRFAGVNVEQDKATLNREYGLKCACCIELGSMADKIIDILCYNYSDLGLSELAAEILSVVIAKPPSVARSDWGVRVLTSEQVKYAALDAHVCFAIIKQLSTDYEKNFSHALRFL